MQPIMRAHLVTSLVAIATACGRGPAASEDRRFADVQDRGQVAMGVDQFTSTHIFESLPDGGRIELERDGADSAGAAQIRMHFREIAGRFANGDFTLPGFVHAGVVPGTAVMAARQERISYTVEFLPRGAALRLRTADSAAVRAIHEFLAFQRQDHHAAGQSRP